MLCLPLMAIAAWPRLRVLAGIVRRTQQSHQIIEHRRQVIAQLLGSEAFRGLNLFIAMHGGHPFPCDLFAPLTQECDETVEEIVVVLVRHTLRHSRYPLRMAPNANHSCNRARFL